MEFVSNNIKNKTHIHVLANLAMISDTIVIVSPFLSADMPKLFTAINENKTIKKISLVTSVSTSYGLELTQPPILLEFQTYCNKKGIILDLFEDEKLHGKVYLFYKDRNPTGFILSSGNFTNDGMDKNHEYGVKECDREKQDELAALIWPNTKVLSWGHVQKLAKEAAKHTAPKRSNSPTYDPERIIDPEGIMSASRCFLKPVGTAKEHFSFSDEPPEEVKHCFQFFDKVRPAVNVGDICITYGVGSPYPILGVFKLIGPGLIEDSSYYGDQWPHYWNSENLTKAYTSAIFQGRQAQTLNDCFDLYKEKYSMWNLKHDCKKEPDLGIPVDLFGVDPHFAKFIFDQIQDNR